MSIVQVAEIAGCSHTTVSRVINAKPNVSPAVAARVRAAMRELNYTPPTKRRGPKPGNRNGQRVAQRTGNVALLTIGTDTGPRTAPVAAAVMSAIEEELAGARLTLAWGQVRDDLRLPPVVDRGEVDGLILHGNPPPPALAARLRHLPSVWVMSPRGHTGYWGDRVCTDNAEVGRIAAEHLVAAGHGRIAFLNVSPTHLGFRTRAEAFGEAAAAAGASVEVVSIEGGPAFRPGDFAAERRFIDALVERFVALPDRPTGFFIPRGQATMMVLDSLRARGIEPGDDITVLACDHDPALAGLFPPVATIDIRTDRIGREAVSLLMQRIARPAEHERTTVLIEPTLVLPG